MENILESSALKIEDKDERKEYVMLNYEDIKNISDTLIEENIEAYRVLAND